MKAKAIIIGFLLGVGLGIGACQPETSLFYCPARI